jgi:hypothetical protein
MINDSELKRLHEQVMKDLSTLFGIPERFLLPKELPQFEIEAKEYEQYKSNLGGVRSGKSVYDFVMPAVSLNKFDIAALNDLAYPTFYDKCREVRIQELYLRECIKKSFNVLIK